MNGKAISVDVPLTDAIDSAYMSGQLVAYTPPNQPSEMGIESLRIELSPTCSGVALTSTNCSSTAIWVNQWTTDSWVRNIHLTGFNNFMSVDYNASRITIDAVTMIRDGTTDNSAGYALDLSIMGTQVLSANRSTLGAKDSRSYSVATKTLAPGPNVVLNYYAQQPVESIEPHERWGHGLLAENSTTASLLFRNRATAGSGHGWSINQGIYNCSIVFRMFADPFGSLFFLLTIANCVLLNRCWMERERPHTDYRVASSRGEYLHRMHWNGRERQQWYVYFFWYGGGSPEFICCTINGSRV